MKIVVCLFCFVFFLHKTNAGDELLDLTGVTCLALDWRNNERSARHCTVRVRPVELRPADGHAPGHAPDATLHQCLEQFMQPEVLGQQEAWYCPR